MENNIDVEEIAKLVTSKLVPGEIIDDNVIRFTKECFKGIQTYAKKNHDYGNSFEDGMDLIGEAYGTGRIYDKAKRLANLTKKKETNSFNVQVTEESMEDTALDLGCYSFMYLSYKNKNKNNIE